MPNTDNPPFFRSLRFKYGLGLTVFLIVAGYFLLAEHLAHILTFASGFLILGLCLAMHFFMHGGHGGHGGHGNGTDNDAGKDDGRAP